MTTIRGVNVFPSQVEEALLRVEGTAPHYLIELSRPGTLDETAVKVEIRAGEFSDEMRQMVEPFAPGTIERSAGKARRVLDHRRLWPG